jgi:hypothetical protein
VLEASDTGTRLELLLLGTTGVDGHTPHDSYDEVPLALAEGFTGVELGLETTEDDDHTPHVSDEGWLVDETGEIGVAELTGDVPQTPHDEVAGVVLAVVAGKEGVV